MQLQKLQQAVTQPLKAAQTTNQHGLARLGAHLVQNPPLLLRQQRQALHAVGRRADDAQVRCALTPGCVAIHDAGCDGVTDSSDLTGAATLEWGPNYKKLRVCSYVGRICDGPGACNNGKACVQHLKPGWRPLFKYESQPVTNVGTPNHVCYDVDGKLVRGDPSIEFNDEGALKWEAWPAGYEEGTTASLPPANTQQWPTFGLNPETFDDPIYNLQLPADEFNDLLSAPVFYKAISADINSLDTFDDKELARVQNLLNNDTQQPRWLNWTNPLGRHYSEFTPEQLVARNRPRILGQYDNKQAFLVERRIGQGHVQLLTSGVFPEWNDLSVDTGVLLLDRIVRTSLVRSLPERTMATQAEMVIPVSTRHQHADHKLTWPVHSTNGTEAVAVELLGSQKHGVVIRGATDRGFYQLIRSETDSDNEVPVMLLGFNGTSDESDLTLQQTEELQAQVPDSRVRWLSEGETLSLEGETYLGSGTWRWLMYLLLVLLLIEMGVLASGSREEKPSTEGVTA